MKIRYALHAATLLASIALPLAAGSITTTYSPNDGGSGAMFDVTTNTNALFITGLDLLDNSTSLLTVEVYIKSGTYSGFDTNPAAWTLVSTTANVASLGAVPTAVTLTPFTLAAGKTYGIYITFTTATNPPDMLYTRGNNTYSNSDLSLSLGEGLNGLFGSTSVFPGRTWDGTINYSLASAVPEPASLGFLVLAAPGFWFMRRRYLRKY